MIDLETTRNVALIVTAGLVLTYLYDRYVKGLVKLLLDRPFKWLEGLEFTIALFVAGCLALGCAWVLISPTIFLAERLLPAVVERVLPRTPSTERTPTQIVIIPAPSSYRLSDTEVFVIANSSHAFRLTRPSNENVSQRLGNRPSVLERITLPQPVTPAPIATLAPQVPQVPPVPPVPVPVPRPVSLPPGPPLPQVGLNGSTIASPTASSSFQVDSVNPASVFNSAFPAPNTFFNSAFSAPNTLPGVYNHQIYSAPPSATTPSLPAGIGRGK